MIDELTWQQTVNTQQFSELRRRVELSQVDAAKRLGLSVEAVIAYEAGKRAIPRLVSLACHAVECRYCRVLQGDLRHDR